MPIGGVDVVLTAPRSADAAKIILGVCLRHWPRGVFHAADELTTKSLNDGSVLADCREFFVFQGEVAAKSWQECGAISENRNTMLHFLINDVDDDITDQEITIVCDAVNNTVEPIINELKPAFQER